MPVDLCNFLIPHQLRIRRLPKPLDNRNLPIQQLLTQGLVFLNDDLEELGEGFEIQVVHQVEYLLVLGEVFDLGGFHCVEQCL